MIEKPEECDACSFKTEDIKFYQHGTGYPEGSGNWLCKVCGHSMSGNAIHTPSSYQNSDISHMIAYCTNVIIEEIRKNNKNGCLFCTLKK